MTDTGAQEEFDELMRDKERRSGHPEDDRRTDSHSFYLSESDEDQNERTPPASHADSDNDDDEDIITGNGRSSFGPSQSRHIIPQTRFGANTGPKGVISDAQNFRDSRREHRQSLRMSSAAMVQQAQNALTFKDQYQLPVVGSEKAPQHPRRTEKDEDEDEEGLGELDEEGEDDDFMSKWRKTRMRELQSGGYESKMHERNGRSQARYGGFRTVDTDGYLDAVENSPPTAVVVVYIYDGASDVSALLSECLRTLAQQHTATKFVRLHYLDAEMEPAGVPALLAYRAGEKFAGLVPLIDEIPADADISAQTLEVVLQRYQILR